MLIARAGDDAAVAVVIAAPSASLSMGGAGDGVGSKQSLEENILSEMRSEAAAAGLRVWEIPARVVLDAGPWDEASGCCSAHGKLRRKAIAKRAGLLTLRVADDEARRPAMNGPKRLSSITENLSAVLAFFSVDSDADAAAFSISNSVTLTSSDADTNANTNPTPTPTPTTANPLGDLQQTLARYLLQGSQW